MTDLPIAYSADPVSSPTVAAPEPATWAMMLVGLGSLAFVAYRSPRRRRLEDLESMNGFVLARDSEYELN